MRSAPNAAAITHTVLHNLPPRELWMAPSSYSLPSVAKSAATILTDTPHSDPDHRRPHPSRNRFLDEGGWFHSSGIDNARRLRGGVPSPTIPVLRHSRMNVQYRILFLSPSPPRRPHPVSCFPPTITWLPTLSPLPTSNHLLIHHIYFSPTRTQIDGRAPVRPS